MRPLLLLLLLAATWRLATMSVWKIVIPEATVNLVTNPSFERDTDGWLAVASNTIARSLAQQWAGAYSLECTYQDQTTGAYYSITLPNANSTYVLSARVWVPADWDGGDIRLRTSSMTGVTRTYDKIYTDGVDPKETWIELVTFEDVATDVTGVVLIETPTLPTAGRTYYFDAYQVEEKDDYRTSYCDGDQDDCDWDGEAHASTSSRRATTRAGGRLLDLKDDYGFGVDRMRGTGMAPVENVLSPRSLIPGAEFQRHRVEARLVQLWGTVGGPASLAAYLAERQALIRALAPDAVVDEQPVLLQYEGAAEVKQLAAHYAGGLDMTGPAGYTERLALQLVAATDPFWHGLGERAASIGPTSGTMRLIIARIDGSWETFGPPDAAGTYNIAYQVLVAHGELLYLAGDFDNFDNVAAADGLAQYAAGAWGAVGGAGTGDDVRALARDAKGKLYIGGTFTAFDGDADADYLAVWDGTSWGAVGVPETGAAAITAVNALAIDPLTGDLYVGGQFLNFGDVADADHIAYWDGTSWNALSTGMGSTVEALAFDRLGNLYAAGSFTTAGPTTVNRVAMWDRALAKWVSLDDGVNGPVYSISISPTGTVYIAGAFTQSTAGKTLNRVARWNGSVWDGMENGVDNTTTDILAVADDEVYLMGLFTEAGGRPLADGLAMWDGSTWQALPIDLPGYPSNGGMAYRNGDLYLATDEVGTAYFSNPVTVTNEGTARAYPIITIERDGGGDVTLERIENLTTGRALLFDLAVQDGERITIDLRPGRRRMTSSYGDGADADTQEGWRILPQSDIAEFFLLPGDNELVVYASPSAPSNLTVIVRWRDAYWSVD